MHNKVILHIWFCTWLYLCEICEIKGQGHLWDLDLGVQWSLGSFCSPNRNPFLYPLIKLASSADYCVRPLCTTYPLFHNPLIFVFLKKELKRPASGKSAMQQLQFAGLTKAIPSTWCVFQRGQAEPLPGLGEEGASHTTRWEWG